MRTFLSLLLFCGLLLGSHTTSSAGEPFRFESTPGRLPKTVVPKVYHLHLDPRLESATVEGHETIEIEVLQPTRQIILNSLELQITHAAIREKGGKDQPLLMEASDSAELLTLTASQELPVGRYELDLAWKGKLGEQTQGLFITRYTTKAGEKRALATQMEPTDARRMFPCWDEPVFRATFELTAVVPQAHMALSNMPIAAEKALAEGRKEIRFSPTPSMASYLIAFAAGEFEAIEEDFAGIKLRIISTEGKAEQGRYALDATKKILTFYNDYFGQPYPLPKLDQFCFPGYPMGGMENWGAIFYNDTTLLVDPATASQANRERVFEVVAHELAHQWFGDLVTMAWWDDLWLNEGFASWMGTKATDLFNPEWHVSEGAAASKEWAMSRDARRTTHPIQQPVVSEAQATDAFDEITYQKGQAFLRMLETYLGPDAFRQGIRVYMARHAYGSTTTADLWAALDASAARGVQAIAANWTEQPGFPLIRVEQTCRDEQAELTLSQERFTIHYPDAPALTWKTPISLAPMGALDTPKVILLGPEPLRLPFGPCASVPKLNLGGSGYFRVLYDEATYAKLLGQIGTLPSVERLNIFADTWALVQSGRVPVPQALDLLSLLTRGEKSHAVWEQMLNVLSTVDGLLLNEPQRPAFRARASALIRPEAQRLGWETREGEPVLDKTLRSSLLESLGTWGDSEVNAEARRRFARFLEDPASLTGDVRKSVLNLVGMQADVAT